MCGSALLVVAALHARQSESEAAAAASKRAKEREQGTRTKGLNDWWQIPRKGREAGGADQSNVLVADSVVATLATGGVDSDCGCS